jgi:hypothetical protein
MEMQEDVAEDGGGPFLFRSCLFTAENGFPDVTGKLLDGFFETAGCFIHT